MKILVLNSDSSPQKTCLYDKGEGLSVHPPACLWEGRIEWGAETAEVTVKSRGIAARERVTAKVRDEVLKALLSTMWSGNTAVTRSASDINAVGHRVAHGGPHFEDPVAVLDGMIAVLGDMDALVFTGGIGDNSLDVRAAAFSTLAYLGLSLHDRKNAQPSRDGDISASESLVRVLVIRAKEDRAVAAECWKLSRAAAPAAKVIA